MAEQIASVTQINPHSTGRRAQNSLNRFKATIDAALYEGGLLLADMATANREAGIRPDLSHRAFLQVHEAIGASLKARGLGIRAHGEMSALMDRLPLQELGWGDLDKSPSSGALDQGEERAAQ